MEDLHIRKVKIKSTLPFLPDWLVGFSFFYEHPQLPIWWARILMLIGIAVCILGIIVEIRGPFYR
jgi:hypothetical protein